MTDNSHRGVAADPSETANLANSRRNFLRAAGKLTVAAGAAGALFAGGSLLIPGRAQADNDADEEADDFCTKDNPAADKKCICFLAGTLIESVDGSVAIESLRIGDLVRTISGKLKPIKWIGQMRFKRGGLRSWGEAEAPVKFIRGSFDGTNPGRDLYISEGHCLFMDGVLVPAKYLINGRTIIRDTAYDAGVLDYFNIELSHHDAIYAEGVPAETFQASSLRKQFDNFADFERIYGPATVTMLPFAPSLPRGGRQELPSRLRSILAPLYDCRRPTDVLRDVLEARAERQAAA